MKKLNFNPIFDKKYESSLLTVFVGLIMGIFWISFVIWNRLIRERLPRDLTQGEVYSLQFWIILWLFLYCFFLLIYKIYKLQKEWRGIETTKPIVKKFFRFLDNHPLLIDIGQWIANYILSGPLFLWRTLYFNSSPTVQEKVINTSLALGNFMMQKIFNDYLNKYHKELISIIIFVYLPRIVAFTIFCYEIVINHKIELFYHIAPILLIPLIYLSLTRILFDNAHFTEIRMQEVYIKIMSITPLGDGRTDYNVEKRDPSISDEFFDAACCVYLELIDIRDRIVNIFTLCEKYDKYANLLLLILLSMSFGTWLLIILELY